MPIAQTGIAAFSDHMPKVLSPKHHAVADYVAAGGFAIIAAAFWNRNRRVAIASLACAGAGTAAALLTDYPGGVTDKISVSTHRRIDMGLAAAASALPNFLGFGDQPEAKFFRIMGIGITAIGAMTDFKRAQRRPFLKAIYPKQSA
jgi:hypothetical protein